MGHLFQNPINPRDVCTEVHKADAQLPDISDVLKGLEGLPVVISGAGGREYISGRENEPPNADTLHRRAVGWELYSNFKANQIYSRGQDCHATHRLGTPLDERIVMKCITMSKSWMNARPLQCVHERCLVHMERS